MDSNDRIPMVLGYHGFSQHCFSEYQAARAPRQGGWTCSLALAFDWLSQESRHLVLMIDMNPGKLCQHHVQYNRLATGEFLPWVLSEIPLLLRGKCLKVRFRLCFMRSYDGLIWFWSTGIETRRPQTASTCAGAWFKGCCWKTVGTSTHVWCLMSAVRAWTTRLDLMEVPQQI